MHNNNHSSLSEKILERIERAGVRPIPKSYFSFKNIAFWTLAALSVLVGGLSVSSIIFRAVNLPAVLPPGVELPIPLFVRLMPFLWIALLSLFSFIAYREVRATRKGYRYAFSTLLLSLLLGSMILGIGFYASGLGARLDLYAARHVPFVGRIDEEQRERWMRPERGFLIGHITAIDGDSFTLEDPEHTLWTVLTNEELATTSLATEVRVGVRGTITDTDTHIFQACDIRSLEFSGERKPAFPQMKRDERERKPDSARIKECEGVRPPYQPN